MLCKAILYAASSAIRKCLCSADAAWAISDVSPDFFRRYGALKVVAPPTAGKHCLRLVNVASRRSQHGVAAMWILLMLCCNVALGVVKLDPPKLLYSSATALSVGWVPPVGTAVSAFELVSLLFHVHSAL
jgi:hypothetical protein